MCLEYALRLVEHNVVFRYLLNTDVELLEFLVVELIGVAQHVELGGESRLFVFYHIICKLCAHVVVVGDISSD